MLIDCESVRNHSPGSTPLMVVLHVLQFPFSSKICRAVDCRRVFLHDNMHVNPILRACMCVHGRVLVSRARRSVAQRQQTSGVQH